MNRYLIAVVACALWDGGATLHGQAPGPRPSQPQPPAAAPGEVRGTVVDAGTGAPVKAASVSVRRASDSTLVAGALARDNGTFVVQGLGPGAYVLRVNMMGYSAHVGEFTVAAQSPRVNAGSIRLARAAVMLEAVQVTAERQVTIAPDRNAYRTRDVAPAASSASEVLESVPSVQVDADGRVSLRGNENVVVQINGRPTPIAGAQLAGYLKQLPANTIDRVEVVPNPSARYDPEGMAGIINIVLKQNVDLGLSGGLLLGASTADRYTGSGNLGYQQGPATWFVSYGFTSDDRSLAGVNDRTRLGAQGAPLSFVEQDIRGTNGNFGHNLNATLDYRLNDRDVVSNALLLNLRGATEESLSAATEWDGTRALLAAYDRGRDSEQDTRMADYTLAFKRTLEPQRHEFSAEVRANRMRDDDRTSLWRRAGTGSVSDAQ
ncbi:MAG TPA: carboxypeptidase regulatory-like domain-containing protein, partial [Longimicrobium sp.]